MNKLNIKDVEKAIGIPFEEWYHQCHLVSLAIVKAGLVEGGRVARGFCNGVSSQHSWIAIGDPYAKKCQIIDPTLWSYDNSVAGIWYGTARDGRHSPHGAGHIFNWGMPQAGNGPILDLDIEGLSVHAHIFLDQIGPLDAFGWAMLFSKAPVEGWPAGEIIERAYANDFFKALIPVDRVGMLTNLNPGGLYLP
jgi:hypothetical protein